jgi:hypothetical protein
MINILATLFFIVALKWAFLFLFVPKSERRRPFINFVSRPTAGLKRTFFAASSRKISCRKSAHAASDVVPALNP